MKEMSLSAVTTHNTLIARILHKTADFSVISVKSIRHPQRRHSQSVKAKNEKK